MAVVEIPRSESKGGPTGTEWAPAVRYREEAISTVAGWERGGINVRLVVGTSGRKLHAIWSWLAAGWV